MLLCRFRPSPLKLSRQFLARSTPPQNSHCHSLPNRASVYSVCCHGHHLGTNAPLSNLPPRHHCEDQLHDDVSVHLTTCTMGAHPPASFQPLLTPSLTCIFSLACLGSITVIVSAPKFLSYMSPCLRVFLCVPLEEGVYSSFIKPIPWSLPSLPCIAGVCSPARTAACYTRRCAH